MSNILILYMGMRIDIIELFLGLLFGIFLLQHPTIFWGILGGLALLFLIWLGFQLTPKQWKALLIII